MGRNRLALTVAALLLALLAMPALAQASGEDVIRDCNDDGHIDGTYTQEEYDDARDNLPSDIDQYSDCRDVIAQAQADGSRGDSGSGGSGNGSGNGSSGGGSGGSSVPTSPGPSRRGGSPKPHEGDPALATESGAYAANQDDLAAYDRAREDAANGGTLPGGLALPAAGDFTPASPHALPLPVLLALLSVGLLVAATSVLVARRRLPALTRVARRVVRR